MKKKLLLLGGGGHCHSVLDSILSLNEYSAIGIIDNADCSCLGIPVIGNDKDLSHLFTEEWTDAFVTVGSVGDTSLRRKLYNMIKEIGFSVPTLIDSTAIVGRNCTLGEGSFIGKRAVINTGSTIGCCSILNTGTIIEHDCKIGAFAHISPGTTLCGQVTVGDDTHVGAGSVVRQGISIGENTIIGAGSVVVKDIPSNVKAYGNPCRVVEE